MGRQSRIDKLGVGSKVLAYSQAGMPHDEIIRKVEAEHGSTLTLCQVSRYLSAHIDSNAIEPPNPDQVREISTQAFREALTAAINEAKAKYEELRDDPLAGWRWFRHYLETLDRMGKVVGAYQPEHQVNVQMNNVYNQEAVERMLRESEAYFKSLEAGDTDAG